MAAVFSLGLALFGESWERRLAKKIVGHFEEQKVLDKFLQASDEYWQDTVKGFEKGANAVEEKFQEHIQHLRELCSNEEVSKEKVENILFLLRKLKDFFTNLPWKKLT